jgi:hypothetical protein
VRYPSATASRIVHAEPLYGAQPPHLDPGLEAVGIQTALLIGGRVEHLVGGLGLGLGLGIRLRLRPRLELGLRLRLGWGLWLGVGWGFGLWLGLGLGFGLGLVGWSTSHGRVGHGHVAGRQSLPSSTRHQPCAEQRPSTSGISSAETRRTCTRLRSSTARSSRSELGTPRPGLDSG